MDFLGDDLKQMANFFVSGWGCRFAGLLTMAGVRVSLA